VMIAFRVTRAGDTGTSLRAYACVVQPPGPDRAALAIELYVLRAFRIVHEQSCSRAVSPSMDRTFYDMLCLCRVTARCSAIARELFLLCSRSQAVQL